MRTAPVLHFAGPDGSPVPVPTVRAKRVRDAQFAYCETCGQWMPPCPYWPASKSRLLHSDATGHKVTLWHVADA